VQHGLSSEKQRGLVAELRSINEALWDIEDAIRDCEHRQEFGAEFHRAGPGRLQDERSFRRCAEEEDSTLWGSKIIEEKSYGGSNSKRRPWIERSSKAE
jgi:hypothetical protein